MKRSGDINLTHPPPSVSPPPCRSEIWPKWGPKFSGALRAPESCFVRVKRAAGAKIFASFLPKWRFVRAKQHAAGEKFENWDPQNAILQGKTGKIGVQNRQNECLTPPPPPLQIAKIDTKGGGVSQVDIS